VLLLHQERRLRAAISAAPGGVLEFERAIRALTASLGKMAPLSRSASDAALRALSSGLTRVSSKRAISLAGL
jgi:hypothetical protein